MFRYFLFLGVLAISCSSPDPKLLNAATTTAKICGAEGVTLSEKISVDTKSGKQKQIELSFSNPKKVGANYPREKITSTAAISFINSLQKNDYIDIDRLKVTVSGEVTSYSHIYEVKDII